MSRNQGRASRKRIDYGINESQGLENCDTGSISPKPSYPSEETDNRILRGYYGG